MNPLNLTRLHYHEEINRLVADLHTQPRVRGFLATDDPPAHTYAHFMQKAFNKFGLLFELSELPPDELYDAIAHANQEDALHGIFVFYPIYGGERDRQLRNSVDHRKDVEGLSHYWLDKLYLNDRFVGRQKKALLPCTPLAVVKILEQTPAWTTEANPLTGKKITIFNRSEVVGKPLAGMLSNDGAEIFSFDIHGSKQFRAGRAYDLDICRADALAQSDIVITGVPSDAFPKVRCDEIRDQAICINFSSSQNFHKNISEKASLFVPRIGPITVLMCVRNALRLFNNFHAQNA